VQNLDAVKAADVVICITGMDGGLASVVAGMVEVPVIALPTSTGAVPVAGCVGQHGCRGLAGNVRKQHARSLQLASLFLR
jgi:NCAIR mutase (PurE)-related protein